MKNRQLLVAVLLAAGLCFVSAFQVSAQKAEEINIDTSATIVSWLSIWGPSVLLAIIALIAPFLSIRISRRYLHPRLGIDFENQRPYLRLASPFYYVRFVVTNNGRTQAEDCEAVLEEIYYEDQSSKWRILPVNLKWSGEDPRKDFKAACFRTIYPGGRKNFCDIGHIEKDKKPFFLTLPRHYLEQTRNLRPGHFKMKISVYAKNAEKVTREFSFGWSGTWKDKEEEMSKEMIVKIL